MQSGSNRLGGGWNRQGDTVPNLSPRVGVEVEETDVAAAVDELELGDHIGAGIRGGIEDSHSGQFFEDPGLRKGVRGVGRHVPRPIRTLPPSQ